MSLCALSHLIPSIIPTGCGICCYLVPLRLQQLNNFSKATQWQSQEWNSGVSDLSEIQEIVQQAQGGQKAEVGFGVTPAFAVVKELRTIPNMQSWVATWQDSESGSLAPSWNGAKWDPLLQTGKTSRTGALFPSGPFLSSLKGIFSSLL